MLQKLPCLAQGQCVWHISQPQRRKPAEDIKLSRTNLLRAVAERTSIVESQSEHRLESFFGTQASTTSPTGPLLPLFIGTKGFDCQAARAASHHKRSVRSSLLTLDAMLQAPQPQHNVPSQQAVSPPHPKTICHSNQAPTKSAWV